MIILLAVPEGLPMLISLAMNNGVEELSKINIEMK